MITIWDLTGPCSWWEAGANFGVDSLWWNWWSWFYVGVEAKIFVELEMVLGERIFKTSRTLIPQSMKVCDSVCDGQWCVCPSKRGNKINTKPTQLDSMETVKGAKQIRTKQSFSVNYKSFNFLIHSQKQCGAIENPLFWLHFDDVQVDSIFLLI